MEDSPPSFTVSSPRRTLSLLRRRRPDRERKTTSSASGASAADRGANPSEVYGFVGAISAVIATVVFLVWAYTPEPWLHALGITYYPNRFWALAVPAYAVMANILALAFYLGLNFITTPPPTSFSTLFGDLLDQIENGLRRIIASFSIWVDEFSLAGFDVSLTDEHSRDCPASARHEDEAEKPIDPIYDVSIAEVNDLMFGDVS